MTIHTNLGGTSELSFQIGLSGPTVYQGQADPTVTPPTLSPQLGDIYIRHTATGGFYAFDGGSWVPSIGPYSGGTITGDVDITGSVTLGDALGDTVEIADDTLLLNSAEGGAGVTSGSAGLVIERGSLANAGWLYDETNDWWGPTGPAGSLKVYSPEGVLVDTAIPVGFGTVGPTPPNRTGIGFPTNSEIGLYIDDTLEWEVDSGGDLLSRSSGNLGNVSFYPPTIYGGRTLVDSGSAAAPSYSIMGDDVTGMFSSGAFNIDFSIDGTNALKIDPDGKVILQGKTATSAFLSVDGTQTSPAFAFASDTDTGVYLDDGATPGPVAALTLVYGGSPRLTINATEATFSALVRTPSGTVSAPGVGIGGSDVGLRHGDESGKLEIIGRNDANLPNVVRFVIDEDGLLTADPDGEIGPETQTIDFTTVAGGTLPTGAVPGAWFDVTTSPNAVSPNTTYRFWFSDGSTTAPAVTTETLVPIAFTGTETDQQVADLVVAALVAADADFVAADDLVGTTQIVTLTLATPGNATDAVDGTTPTTAVFAVVQDGVDGYEDLVTSGTDDAIPNKKWVSDNFASGGAFTPVSVNFAASPYAVSASDRWLVVDCSGGNVVLDLHAVATSRDNPLYITKQDATANTVNVTPNGAETINGAAGVTSLTLQYETLTIMHNSSEWFVL